MGQAWGDSMPLCALREDKYTPAVSQTFLEHQIYSTAPLGGCSEEIWVMDLAIKGTNIIKRRRKGSNKAAQLLSGVIILWSNKHPYL